MLTRTDIINALIRRRGYRSYLEIGVRDVNHNFAHVACERKCGVDPDPGVAGIEWHVSSDTFFRANTDRFDVIFIDGMHEEPHVDADIRNGLGRLNPGGAIVLHDCLPPDAWHQRPAAAYGGHEAWHGTVWKSVLKYFATSAWDCYAVDCDEGCGVIDTSARAAGPPRPVAGPLEYARDFGRLRPYVVSPARFLTRLYGVRAFYHVASLGDWERVVREHLDLAARVGLDALSVTHVGPRGHVGHIEAEAAARGVAATVVRHADSLALYETLAMRLVEQWAAGNDGSILYFHTKGVSGPGDARKRKWRDLMTREVVGRWPENVLALDAHDVVGVNWRDMPPISHFSGNFWWARSDWVRSLAPFDAYYRNPRYPCDWEPGRRLGCEFWIGSADRAPRVKSLVCRDEDFCGGAFLDALP